MNLPATTRPFVSASHIGMAGDSQLAMAQRCFPIFLSTARLLSTSGCNRGGKEMLPRKMIKKNAFGNQG